MILVLQRVAASAVTVDGECIARIGPGLLVLFGAERGDTEEAITYLADKTVHLRIFADDAGKMNRSVEDTGGEILVVSQFTLAGDCTRGRRPGFDQAAAPEDAERLYLKFAEALAALGVPVRTGRFAAHMRVDLTNDGPVTFILKK